jgi:hypothetical protein
LANANPFTAPWRMRTISRIRGQGSRPGTFAHHHRLNETLSGTVGR